MSKRSKPTSPVRGRKATNAVNAVNAKVERLAPAMADGTDQVLTTNQGLPINDDQNSLKAGERGGTLLEDFILREKITHFDHERIPERIVHARGSAAHGVFRVYEPMAGLTRAHFLQDPSVETPVFGRFSTVAGSRGSTNLARDVRGFAVKFYTFHWKPLLGMHSVAWDEATKISGKDPDVHRRDLWEAIESGNFPEYEFGVQIVEEKDEHKFDFDLLDPTKIIPEEIVPVRRIGRLTLNRNPDNFFAETEQVAFHPGHIVPGIDFTNDPLLQGRLFSYTDTQLSRLGGPNFHQIPINQPVSPVHNHQRDGIQQHRIDRGRVAYEPNSLGVGCPFQAGADMGGFISFAERIDAPKVRARSRSFFDHFSQAALFFRSQAPYEQQHIVNALRFELGKVEVPAIRERMVFMLSQVDRSLAEQVAQELGIAVPTRIEGPLNKSMPADANPKDFQPTKVKEMARSPALSMANTPKDSIRSRKIAALVADGFDGAALAAVKGALSAGGAQLKIIAPHLGTVKAADGSTTPVDHSLRTVASVLFDAVYVAGGQEAAEVLVANADALHFVDEAYRHCKAIAATGTGLEVLRASYLGAKGAIDTSGAADQVSSQGGVVTGGDRQAAKVASAFVAAIAQHRFWAREAEDRVPA